MKKPVTKKLFGIVVLLMAVMMLLSACKKDDAKNIEGTWKLTDVKSAGMSDENLKEAKEMISSGQMKQTFVLKDGKGTYTITRDYGDGNPMTLDTKLTYKIDGSKLIMTEEGTTDSQPMEFKIDGNKLELTVEGGTMIFTKQ